SQVSETEVERVNSGDVNSEATSDEASPAPANDKVSCFVWGSGDQRLQYAKHFCYLTSSRRARKYDLPHFRLNKARNIKVWLSLRSYLRKRGPQRSTNSVIASVFYTFIAICCLMCIQLLQAPRQFLQQMGNWDLLVLTAGLSIFLLQFITLGTKINKKFPQPVSAYHGA
uniref:Neur_chan_memb domain-containing protein n=1 Tax=Macrostomum lignano TaxID=282301 RepID=A0A1I8FIF1_9PLAT